MADGLIKILVIDDEINTCTSLQRLLGHQGYEVISCQSGPEALDILAGERFQLVVTDLRMPEMSGIELLASIKEIDNELPVILITAFSTVRTAVEAMKKGAFDYISKPFNKEELLIRIERALRNKTIVRENRLLKAELEEKYHHLKIIGKSKPIQSLYQTIEKVASTDTTVLIRGESGTGKELVARAIHYSSLRKNRPLVYLDCSSLVENLLESELFGHEKGSFTGAERKKTGLFESANGGTLFLDEIGNISLSVQAKLLRVLQEKEIKPVGSNITLKIDVRLITATNKNIEEMIKKETFRNDLYYRLNVVPIRLPPLRERREDILLLANHFFEKYRLKFQKNFPAIPPEIVSLLENYDWPGNVRELENVIERLMVMSNDMRLEAQLLPSSIREFGMTAANPGIGRVPRTNEELKLLKKAIRKNAVKEIERKFVMDALERNAWNISRAAGDVGLKRENFYSMMERCHISRGKLLHTNATGRTE